MTTARGLPSSTPSICTQQITDRGSGGGKKKGFHGRLVNKTQQKQSSVQTLQTDTSCSESANQLCITCSIKRLRESRFAASGRGCQENEIFPFGNR